MAHDNVLLKIRKVMDATRISDGRVVAIKQVPADSPEIELGEMLSTSESLKDPLNHCVPILDHFTSPNEPDLAFIVMPLLRAFDDPEFFDISEVLDFMTQTLEVRTMISSARLLNIHYFYRERSTSISVQ